MGEFSAAAPGPGPRHGLLDSGIHGLHGVGLGSLWGRFGVGSGLVCLSSMPVLGSFGMSVG